LAQLKVYDKDRQRAPDLTDALSQRLMKSDPSTALPEPHILDYDWRYTAQTVLDLSALVRPSDTVLAVGTPSLARHLEALGRDVTLVDRQPFQAVRNHLQIEAGIPKPNFQRRSFAIVDPPWYPADAKLWIAWTAHRVMPRERILVSLWPDITRPAAANEFEDVTSWIREWADIESVDIVPRYEIPLFERAALCACESQSNALSPGYARLLCLRARHLPSILEHCDPQKTWVRFVVNDYQLAVCLNENSTGQTPVSQHPLAKGWVWPYVSKRAPQQDQINLWSSRNEVAILRHPHLAAEALRKAFKAADPETFKVQLGPYIKLRELYVPHPPYRRLLEWRHLQ